MYDNEQRRVLQIENITAAELFCKIESLQRQIAELSEQLSRKSETVRVSTELSKKLLTVEDVLKLFHISRPTLMRWKKGGMLKSVRYGNRIYFRSSDIESVLDNQ